MNVKCIIILGVLCLNAFVPPNENNYEITRWKGFANAAIPNILVKNIAHQYNIGIPMFDKYRFIKTFNKYENKFVEAAEYDGRGVFLLHGIDYDDDYLPVAHEVFGKSLLYLTIICINIGFILFRKLPHYFLSTTIVFSRNRLHDSAEYIV